MTRKHLILLLAWVVIPSCASPSRTRVDHAVGGLVNSIVADARIHGAGENQRVTRPPWTSSHSLHGGMSCRGIQVRGRRCFCRGRFASVTRDAIRCGKRPGECRVLDDRVYVRLDSLAALPGGGLAATVTYAHTDRRSTGNSFIGFVQTRLELTRKGDRWEIRRRDVIMST